MAPRAEARLRGGESFPKADRLLRRADFRRVQEKGRRVHTPHFLIILIRRGDTRTRLGVTVTKKVGTAVRRNRIKRVVREVFRRNRRMFPRGADVVCIAKRGVDAVDYETVRSEMERAQGPMRAALRTRAGAGGTS